MDSTTTTPPSPNTTTTTTTLTDLLTNLCRKQPDREVVVTYDEALTRRSLTRHQLYTLASRLAHILKTRGLQRGDVVTNTLPVSLEAAVVIFGAILAGGGVVTVDVVTKSAEELFHTINKAQSKMVVTRSDLQDHGWEALRNGIHKSDTKTFFIQDFAMPRTRSVNTAIVANRENTDDNGDDFLAYLDKQTETFVDWGVKDTDKAFTFLTSGTTGFPKLAVHTHGNMAADVVNGEAALVVRDPPGMFIATSWSWIVSSPVDIMWGMTRVSPDFWHPPKDLFKLSARILQQENVRMAFLSPVFVERVAKEWGTKEWDTKDRDTKDRDTKDRDTKDRDTKDRDTKDRDTKDRDTKDRDTKDRDTKDRDTKDWDTKDWDTKDRDTKDWDTKEWDTKDRDTKDRDTKDRDTKDRDTKDRDTKDRDTKDRDTKDRDTKDWDTKDWDTKDWDTKDWDTKEWDTKDRDTKDRDTKDRDTKDRDTKDRDTKDWDTKDWDTKDRDTKDWDTKDRDTKDWDTKEWDTKDRDTKDRDTKDRDTKDRDTKDRDTKDRDTKDRDTKDRDTKDWDTKDWDTKDWDTKDWDTKEWDTKDRDTKDRDTKDRDTKDRDTKDRDTKDWDTKDWDTKDRDTKDRDTKDRDTKDRDTKDRDTKDWDTKEWDTKDRDTKDRDTKDRDTKDRDTKDRDTKDRDTKNGTVIFDQLFVGGAPVDKVMCGRLLQLARVVTIRYGQSENLNTAYNHVVSSRTYHSHDTGRPYRGTDIRVVDDNMEDVAPGDPGRILIKTESMFVEYLNDLEKTASSLTGDGWYNSSDAGYLRADNGNVVVIGRYDYVIHHKSVHLYPAWIEKPIKQDPRVAEAMVVPVPDENNYHNICACVILKPGHPMSAAEVQSAVRNFRTDDTKHVVPPQHVLFYKAFPTNARGKVVMNKLIEDAATKVKNQNVIDKEVKMG